MGVVIVVVVGGGGGDVVVVVVVIWHCFRYCSCLFSHILYWYHLFPHCN